MHRRPVEFQIGDYVIVFAQRGFPQEPSLNCILIVLVLKFCNELDQMLTSLISYLTMVLARPLMLRTLLPLKAMSPHQMILFLLPLLLHLCLPLLPPKNGPHGPFPLPHGNSAHKDKIDAILDE